MGHGVSVVVGAISDAADVKIFGFAYGPIRCCDNPDDQVLLGDSLAPHFLNLVLNRNCNKEENVQIDDWIGVG